MRTRILLLTFGTILTFVNSAESGGAVAKAKAKNTRPRIHVQVPRPRLHVTQVPTMEGNPTIHIRPPVAAPELLPEEPPEAEYQSQVLSTKKPDLGLKPASRRQTVQVEDIVDFPQLIEALQSSSQNWNLIVDNADKQLVVQEFIDRFTTQNVAIVKPAGYYVNLINDMSQASPQMLDVPFERLLQVVAVMEYDFDNGEDQDMMAQKILGPQAYAKNKLRIVASRKAGN